MNPDAAHAARTLRAARPAKGGHDHPVEGRDVPGQHRGRDRKEPEVISQATLDQLQKLGQEIQRDSDVVKQRSIAICWHWWNVGKALTADPGLYIRDTKSIPVDTLLRICEALGLSTKMNKSNNRPNGALAIHKAIDTYSRFPDEDDARKAIDKAGTFHNLLLGTSYGSRLAKSMSVPTALLDQIHEATGVEGRQARRYIAQYLKMSETRENIVAYVRKAENLPPVPDEPPGKKRKKPLAFLEECGHFTVKYRGPTPPAPGTRLWCYSCRVRRTVISRDDPDFKPAFL